jgi:hypothetical protein
VGSCKEDVGGYCDEREEQHGIDEKYLKLRVVE